MDFQVVKEIPAELTPKIQQAVMNFIEDSHPPDGADPAGFYYQTLESIANATYLNAGGDFWLATNDGEVAIYLIAHVTKDIDNRLTYWISQCQVAKPFRGQKIVKDWWQQVRARAKALMCSHMVVVSSRGVDAYCRFLGPGWGLYANLLKESF